MYLKKNCLLAAKENIHLKSIKQSEERDLIISLISRI